MYKYITPSLRLTVKWPSTARMSSQQAKKTRLRKPEWLRIKLPGDATFSATKGVVGDCSLHTVCQSARCPNIFECFSKSVATFMILGTICTRGCSFCNIGYGAPPRQGAPVDPGEPKRLAAAAQELGLKYVVLTSVTRDDLADGGAGQFAAVIRELRVALPHAAVEVLIPDFQGDEGALNIVLDAGPDVLNHNVETVPELYPSVRPQAIYARSLELLRRASARGAKTKSGLMLGFGESPAQVRAVIDDLAAAGCDAITIGQYLQPSRKHPEPLEYVHPDVFAEYAEYGRKRGVSGMHCGPLVRSSYMAEEVKSSLE